MSYLVDSDWVADYLKGRPSAVQLLNSLFRDGISISIITFAEIYEGVYYSQTPEQHEAVFRRFLQGVSVLPINGSVGRRFAILRGALRRTGQIIPHTDAFIAATALVHDLTLVRRDQHFARIPDLKLHHVN